MLQSRRDRLCELLLQQLDTLARSKGFSDLRTRLTAAIANEFEHSEAAEPWVTPTLENVMAYLEDLFTLKVRGSTVTLAPRPKTSVSEALERLKRPDGPVWDKAWIEMPSDAYYALNVAANHYGVQLNRLLSKFNRFNVRIPGRVNIIPLVNPAIKIAPLLVTNDKSSRDAMLGSMLRMWNCRDADPDLHITFNDHSGGPVHAWKFIDKLAECYRGLFTQLKIPLADDEKLRAKDRNIFDIPSRRATKEDIYNKYVLWRNWPTPKIDIAKAIEEKLAG